MDAREIVVGAVEMWKTRCTMIFAASLWQDGQTASGIPLLRMLDPDRAAGGSLRARALTSGDLCGSRRGLARQVQRLDVSRPQNMYRNEN